MKLHLSLSALLLTLFVFQSSAQNKTVEFGLRGGFNISRFARVIPKGEMLRYEDNYGFGYVGGGFVNLNKGAFTLQPAVILNNLMAKGEVEKASGDIIDVAQGTWRLNFIQVPVNLIYRIPTGDGNYYIGAGAYAASGLWGKFTPDASKEPDEYKQRFIDYHTQSAKFGNDRQSNFRLLDYGLNVIGGFDLDRHFIINIMYSHGLANMLTKEQRYSEPDRKGSFRSFSLSLDYKF